MTTQEDEKAQGTPFSGFNTVRTETGRFDGSKPNLNSGFLSIDYAAMELDMAQAMIDNAQLNRWIKGDAPDMNVRFEFEDDTLIARWGKFGKLDIGSDTKRLEAIGYEFQIRHYRDYFNVETEEVERYRPNEAIYKTPFFTFFAYHATAGDKDDFSDPANPTWVRDGVKFVGWELDQDPETRGGACNVIIFAPSGHWGEGESTCAPDDVYNKKGGRTLAFQRAFEKLNEVRCG